MSRHAIAICIGALLATLTIARADEPAFTDDPVVRGALPPELQAFLLHAERFEVLLVACERGTAPDEEALLRYPIVRRVELPHGDDRARLLSRVYQGIAEADQGVRAGCFEPHHAIRATQGERSVVLVICFQCVALEVQDRATGHFARPQITSAAREELERHLGPIVDRAFAGRTLAEWRQRFHELSRSEGASPPALEPEDVQGVQVLADAIAWSHPADGACARALRKLGPAAALAIPALRRVVDAGPRHPGYRSALSVVETIGPAAADLAPTITAHLRAVVADPTDEDAPGLVHAAAGALGGLGPAASEALQLLDALAADGRWSEYVRRRVEAAVEQISAR